MEQHVSRIGSATKMGFFLQTLDARLLFDLSGVRAVVTGLWPFSLCSAQCMLCWDGCLIMGMLGRLLGFVAAGSPVLQVPKSLQLQAFA